MLGALLIPLLACPPTSVPASDHAGGHFLASPYGVHELEPTPSARRTVPTTEAALPVWDPGASLAEVERQLALDEPPTWAPWVAWALARSTRKVTAYEHLLAALSSPQLSAEHLAWWRSVTPDPTFELLRALDRSTAAKTRALLTTSLALIEYRNSCPVAVDLDGACRAPDSALLLRRSTIALERARHWTKLARKHWAKLDVDAADLATRALWAELELAVMIADYEELLTADPPTDLWFVVEDWRHGAGVPAWEAEYEFQLAQAEESRARSHAFFESTIECARTQMDGHGRLLWIDARSSGVALLRNARIFESFADMVVAMENYELYRQAARHLDLCIELADLALDDALAQACRDSLWQLDHDGEAPLAEFIVEPRASTTVHRIGVVGLD